MRDSWPALGSRTVRAGEGQVPVRPQRECTYSVSRRQEAQPYGAVRHRREQGEMQTDRQEGAIEKETFCTCRHVHTAQPAPPVTVPPVTERGTCVLSTDLTTKHVSGPARPWKAMEQEGPSAMGLSAG